MLILICGVLLFVGLQTGKIGSGSGKETITDAEGEKIKQGHGTVEMSVQDTDGTIRKITSDKSLITPEAILKEYTSVMNGLKNDAPAFTKLRYQNLPTENQNLGAIAAMVLPIIERYVTSKTAARPIDYAAGNADSLPIQNSPYGCLLTDASRIKNAYCEILEDGAYKLVITLQTESNPAIPAPGATSSDSAVGGVFAPYDAAEQITAISNLALSNIDFTYTDCTAELIYTHKTQQVQSLTMTMNIDVTADAHIAQLQARIVDITEYTDIVY